MRKATAGRSSALILLLFLVLGRNAFAAATDVAATFVFPNIAEDPGNRKQALVWFKGKAAPSGGPTYWDYFGGFYADDGTNNEAGYYWYDGTDWVRLLDAFGGSGTPAWSGRHTFNGGVSLGTSGSVESSVADGASVVAFDNDWKVNSTTGNAYVFQVRNSTKNQKYMIASTEGEFSFGNNSALGPSSGIVLAFNQNDSVGTPTWKGGVAAGLLHTSSSKTPTWIFGVSGLASQGTTTAASSGPVAGVVGSLQATSDTAAYSALELIGVLARSNGNPESTGIDNTTTSGAGMKGDWKRAALFRAGFVAHSGPGTGGTNRPAISTGATLDIPGFSTITGKQYGLEVISSTAAKATGNNASDAVTSAAIYAEFPNRTEDATHQNKLAHAYLVPKAAAAGGPAYWNLDGGLYFDSGTNNTKGLYTYVGAWRREVHNGDCINIEAISSDFAGAGTTEYASVRNGTVNATETSIDDYLTPAALTFHTLRVRSDTQPGGSDTYTITLRSAGAGTALTCIVTSASYVCADTTNRVNVAADTKVDVQFVPTGTAANPGEVLISLCTAPQ